MNLRRWLRREPRPHHFRADGRDVALPATGNVWAQLEETIVSLSPSKLEAVAADGSLLRAVDLAGDDDQAAQLVPAPTTERAGELASIARMISEAHDAGARRHAQAYELAFARHTELVAILAQRLSGLESAWQRAMQQMAQLQADAALAQVQASEQSDPAAGAIAAMISAGLSAPALTNGAAKKA